jgi:hypothetical protein
MTHIHAAFYGGPHDGLQACADLETTSERVYFYADGSVYERLWIDLYEDEPSCCHYQHVVGRTVETPCSWLEYMMKELPWIERMVKELRGEFE